MAYIRVKNLQTGKTGKLPEENFDSSKYERLETAAEKPDRLSKFLSGVEKYAPTVGTVAAPIIGGIGTGGISLGASGLLAGAGYAGGRGAANIAREVRKVHEDPQGFKGFPEALQRLGFKGTAKHLATGAEGMVPELAKTGAGATAAILSDMLFGKVSQAALGKIYGALGKGKIGTPKAVGAGAKEVAEETGERLGQIVGEAGERGARVDPAPIVEKLTVFRDKMIKKKLPRLEKGLNEVIERLGKPGTKLTPEDAWMLKQGFWDEIFGEAGRELLKRSKGKTIKAAGKIAGGELSEKINKTLIEEGFEKAPELFKKYGAAGKLSREMTKPFKGAYQGSIIGGALSLAGLPELGVPVALTIMPYSRYLIQQLLGRVVGASAVGAKVGVAEKISQFLGGDR